MSGLDSPRFLLRVELLREGVASFEEFPFCVPAIRHLDRHQIRMGSQFIIATHSPIIMGYPDSRIYHFTEEGIDEIEYRQTDHYQVTRRFLDNPDKMLAILFEPDPADSDEPR